MSFVTQSTFYKIDYYIRFGYVGLSLITWSAMHLVGDDFGAFLLLMVPSVLLYPYFLLSSFVKAFSPKQHIRPFYQHLPHFEVFVQGLYMLGFYFNPFDLDMRVFWIPHTLISILFIRHFLTFKSIYNEKK